jgi:hypothetical protein
MTAPARLAASLFVAVLSVYVLTASGHVQTIDVGQELDVARSIVTRASFTVADPSAAPGRNGARYSPHGIGESILLLPVVLIEPAVPRAYRHAAEAMGTSLLNPLAAALIAAILLLLLLDLGFAPGVATALALLASFASILWPYAHDAFDVTPTATCLLFSLFAAHRYLQGRGTRWLLASGAAAAFALLLRLPTLAMLPVLLAYLLAVRPEVSLRGRVVRGLLWAAPVGVAAALIGGYDLVRFGNPLQTGYGLVANTGFGNPVLLGVAGLVLSPGKSLFVFSPVLLLAVLGFRRFTMAHRPLAGVVAGSFAVSVLLYAAWDDWAGGWSWGPRFLITVMPILLLPAASLLAGWHRYHSAARAAIVAVVAASIAIQVAGVAVDYQVQTQLRQDAGRSLDYWRPIDSPIAMQLNALREVIDGRAPYPASRIALDRTTGRPSTNTWDFWWVYALIVGLDHRLLLALIAIGLACAVAATVRLIAALRSAAPTRPSRRSPGVPHLRQPQGAR